MGSMLGQVDRRAHKGSAYRRRKVGVGGHLLQHHRRKRVEAVSSWVRLFHDQSIDQVTRTLPTSAGSLSLKYAGPCKSTSDCAPSGPSGVSNGTLPVGPMSSVPTKPGVVVNEAPPAPPMLRVPTNADDVDTCKLPMRLPPFQSTPLVSPLISTPVRLIVIFAFQ